MKFNVGRLLSRVFEYHINKSVIFFISQIMDRHGAQLHVATVTRWNSELRSIESYLALSQATLDDLADTVPSLASKIVDETGRRGLQELVKVIKSNLKSQFKVEMQSSIIRPQRRVESLQSYFSLWRQSAVGR